MRRGIGSLLLCILVAGCAGGDARPHVRLPLVQFEKVTLVDADATVRWFVLDATVVGPDQALVAPSPITRFALERDDVVSGKRTVLAGALPPTARSFEDRGLDPGGRYRYRLTFQVAEGTRDTVESGPFDGPKLWTLVFKSPTNAFGTGCVFVRIRKYEKGIGWVDAGHTHDEGDRIGWWKEETDAVVSQHPVRLGDGTTLRVDFNTGTTLTAVRPARKVVEVHRCKAIYELETGKKLGCDKVVEKRTFDCFEISFRDSQGNHLVNVPEPRVLDQICPEHQANPDAAPAEPRLFEVRRLLDEADRLWNVDSAASIKLYQRLLREHKDDVIRLQVRNKVEGRARQADD